MHLQLFGYRDNPSSPLVIADKLKLLIQQERAWSRLDFEKQTSVHLPFHPSSIYELSDGIFLLGEGSASLSGTNIIRWARLSSLADGMSSDEHWGRISVGAHIIDVGLSVQEHDLVVVATECVRYVFCAFPHADRPFALSLKSRIRRPPDDIRAAFSSALDWPRPSPCLQARAHPRDHPFPCSAHRGSMQRVH